MKIDGISESVTPCKRPYKLTDLYCNDCLNFSVYDGRHRRYEICSIDYDEFHLRWSHLPTFECPFRKLPARQLELF